MKKRITFVLLAVFLAASALVLYAAEKESFKHVERFEMRRAHGGAGSMLPAGLTGMFKLADKLELTNPQLLQLRMLYQKQSAIAKKHKADGKLDKKLGKKLSDPNLKEEDIKKYAAEKAKELETRILAKYQMQQELKKILTSEQCKKLEQMKAKKPGKKGVPFFKAGKMCRHPGFGLFRKAPGSRPGSLPEIGTETEIEADVEIELDK